jgi:hypothetical protein
MGLANKKCKQCKCKLDTESAVKTPLFWFCSQGCAFEYAKLQAEKTQKRKEQKAKQVQAKKEKADRERLRERKEELRPLKWYADRAQSEFNKFIRLRDKGLPCVSCGKPDDGTHQRHASHYRSRGACSYLRFDESNVASSCAKCNNHLSGNIEGFTPELIRRVGRNEYDRIINSPKTKRWTKEELIEIYETYKAKRKELDCD